MQSERDGDDENTVDHAIDQVTDEQTDTKGAGSDDIYDETTRSSQRGHGSYAFPVQLTNMNDFLAKTLTAWPSQ
ncbi:hypothetical protein [Rhizobium leguminosarum]|uniref:hypothetical protein n=1 Tax=Rhizobium leguminosarum TaxID=384 RepID=UPI0021BBD083|nr:hypothetical protein [Rhizobium leguminosarum]